MKILLVEDEKMTRVALSNTLRKEGHEVVPCPDGHLALSALDSDGFDLILTDLNLPGPDGLEVLTRAREVDPEARVIIMTAYASTRTAVEALRNGAYDYVIKPFQPEEILTRVKRVEQLCAVVEENRILRRQLQGKRRRSIVGNSPGMKRLVKTIETVAPSDYNVLIQGQSGTGKELVARAVHDSSLRREGPFVAVNCTAIPESLLESELFGFKKGAFTGAIDNHAGYFSRADGGSIFLDDIDDLPVTVQAKLLRVIQEREIEPVGGGTTEAVDFRLIAASKVDLKEHVAGGRFREDLYYRLNVIPLHLPTLAERKEDIPDLVRHFVARHAGKEDLVLKPECFEALLEYDWPGNVRELENVIERMLAMPDVPVRDLFDTPLRGDSGTGSSSPRKSKAFDIESEAAEIPTYRDYIAGCEADLIHAALERAEGNITSAARILDLPRSTLRSKMEKFDS